MSKASGFVLILAGLAAAAYVLPQGGSDSGDFDLPQFSDVAKTPPEAASAPTAPINVAVAPEPQAAARPSPPPAPIAAPIRSAAVPAPVVVTLPQRPSEPTATKPAPMPRDRDAIGRELQKELRRVGCYEGELNGVWTPMTRQAMKSFTDRVNATLPVDEPDSILLTLVQAYQDRVCGKACPTGQGMSEAGRCVPSAILARNGKKPAAPPATIAAAVPEPKPAPAITGWTTSTSTMPTAIAATPPVVAAPAVPGAQPPPATLLPGDRMALAGPTTPEGAQPGTPAPPAAAPPTPKPAAKGDTRTNWARSVFNMRDSQN